MKTELIFAIQFFTNLITYALIVIWFAYYALKKQDKYTLLTPFVFFHSIRTLRITATVPTVVGEHIASTQWAHHVAIGDFSSVILAWLTVAALKAKKPLGFHMCRTL